MTHVTKMVFYAKNYELEHLRPLPEAFKVLQVFKEMDDTWLDLIKDFRAGSRPKQANMRPMDVPES